MNRSVDPPKGGCYWGLYSAHYIYREVPRVYGAGSTFSGSSRGPEERGAPDAAPVSSSCRCQQGQDRAMDGP